GIGTIDEGAGPLVHLWLNRTVVAEASQSTTTIINLDASHYLEAGVGYTLGASFENPWFNRTARFDVISAAPSDVVPSGPPAPAVAADSSPSGWPQFGRDAYNTRSSDDITLPTASTVASTRLAWRTSVDGSVTGTPAVA